jgi:hypothetical protein
MYRCCNTRTLLSVERRALRPLVNLFIEKHRPGALREKEFFESLPSLELAIYHAAFALDEREKRYSHQRRIRMGPMTLAYRVLLRSRNRLVEAHSFDNLHGFLRAAFSRIHGIGSLYTYDTTLRLGFFLKLTPTKVYLHAGTRKGARALGFRNGDFVKVSDLPNSLADLVPYEIEDFLCIFKPRIPPDR